MEPLVSRRLFLSLCLCLACVAAALAVEEPPSRRSVQFTERGAFRVYPEVLDSNLFLSPLLNFEALSDQIVIGAADNLFILNRDLSLSTSVSWPSDPQSRQDCISTNNNNEDSIECRNHVSIYEAIPGSDDSLFVCGTGAYVPQCRTLEVSSSSGDVMSSSDSAAAPGLLSPSPDLPSFGEFRRRPTNLNGGALDLRYFSVGFQSTSIDSFDLSYQSVAVQPGDNTVATQRLYGLKSGDSQWMADPATFVDFYRADYAPLNPNTPEDYQFYFVFLREQLVLNSASQNVIISRVLRICRNDPGVNVTAGSSEEPVFSTFIKARILCEREVPPGVIGALDFQYNEIRSVGFNSRGGGRYTENGDWRRFMYGAFSGAVVGPVGTAICLYQAGNSENFGGGIFDIFREDVQQPNGMGEDQNDFLECDPAGRNGQEAEQVTVVRDVRQEDEDPILVFDGFFVSQIAVDSVCVVSSTDPTACLDQDVLWLGTSVGSVMKVVFTSDRSPLVLEDIQLTDDGTTVNDLKLETVDGVKYLFAATQRRVYRLPLEKCSTYDFDECISSQDPYCVWNSLVIDGRCQLNTLVANQEGAIPFPPFLVQNIHTGEVTIPTVEFAPTSYVVPEGQIVRVELTSLSPDRSFTVNVTAVNGRAVGGTDFTFPSELVTFTPAQTTVAVSVETHFNPAYRQNNTFTLRVASNGATPIRVINPLATVRIIDRDGARFQLGLFDVGSCANWIPSGQESEYLAVISRAVASVISERCKDCRPYNETFLESPTFSCSDQDPDLVVYRASFLVTPPQTTRELVSGILEAWVQSTPEIDFPDSIPEIDRLKVEPRCQVIIDEMIEDPGLCVYEGGPQGLATGSSSTVGGLIAGVVILIIVAVALVVALIVVVVLFYKKVVPRKNSDMPESRSSAGVALMSQTSRSENGNKIDVDSGGVSNPNPASPDGVATGNRYENTTAWTEQSSDRPATAEEGEGTGYKAVEYKVHFETVETVENVSYEPGVAKLNLSEDLDPPNS